MRLNVILSLVKNQIIAAKPLEQFMSSASKKGNKVVALIVKIVGILFISASFLFLLGSSYFGYLYIAKSFNIFDKGIAYCVFISTIFLLFISTTYLEYTYFRGKDINLWKLLPISKSEFFLSRFLASYCYSLFANLIVTLPLVATIFFFEGFSLLTLISSIILFLFLPILPIVLSSLLITIKVYLLKGKSIKIVDILFNNGPFLFGVLYLSKMSTSMTELLSTADDVNQLSPYQGLIENIGSLPYFSMMGKMFFSFPSLILFILIATLVFMLSYFIIAPLFEKCLNFINEENNKSPKKKTTSNISNVEMKSSSILTALIKRELFVLKGETGFLTESISEAFIPFILIGVWAFSGSLDSISLMIGGLSQSRFFVAGVFLIVQLFAAMVLISSTSVSREGKLFKINEVLPINSTKIVLAKVIFHLLFVTFLQVLYLIAFIFFLKINLAFLFWMIPLFILNSVNISLIGLFIDYNNPRLEWDNATSAMKRNMNALLGMGGSIVVILPSIGILFINSSYYIMSIIISVVISILLWKIVNNSANKLINRG